MRERQIGVIPERLEETIRPLAALADLANSHKDAISQIADSLFEQRRLFRNMQLSGAIYEEEKKKGKDKKDEKRDDLESFLERLDIFDNTNVAVVTNPLQLLGSLHNELLMQYVFLKDALGKLGNLKVNKILEGSTEYYNYSDFDERLLELLRARRALERKIGNRLDGIDLFKAPDKARNALENVAEDVSGFEQTKIVFLRTLASRLQGSDVRAIKCFRQAMQLPEAAELEAVASSLVNDYASIIMRVNETSEGMLKSIAGLQEKLQAIWRITEETYKALSGEYIGKSKNKVILNPLMTNVLKVIYADFPGADEVGKGATPSQVSKYSLLKAANLLRAVANPKVYALLKNPELVWRHYKKGCRFGA